MKVFITPDFTTEDKGDGGIRRVVEAQRRYLPSYGIEVVSNQYDADLVAAHGGMRVETNLPYIEHCHGLYWAEYKWDRWSEMLNKEVVEALHRADGVTAPSEWVAQTLRRGMWLAPEVIGHGIDLDEWPLQRRTQPTYVLWNKTRVDAVCDPEPVNRLAEMAQSIPFRTTFAAAKPQLTPNVTVTGAMPYDQAKAEILGATVYLATSRETYGIGTLEAMAAGVPVLGWNWGGQREFIKHKETGWLAEPSDYDGLFEGLKYIYDEANFQRMSKAARQYAKTRTWKTVVKQYADFYERVLAAWQADQARKKVSVIVTSYNLGQYLPETIKSIQAQEFPKSDLEIVIVDDCSTDGSYGIAKELADADETITLLQTPYNLYLAGALNYGIARAAGRYILPLDADNMLGSENSLSILSATLDADKRWDIVYGGMSVIDGKRPEWTSDWPPTSFNFAKQLNQGGQGRQNQISSTAMYRRRVWERTGGYRQRCRTAEDADFWCRATSIGFRPTKVTEVTVLRYRDRADSMSHVEKDWGWHEWFPWSKAPQFTPMGAPGGKPRTYEPVGVTVVIPVGPGHERVCVDALDSVIAQSYQNWELILVNDSGNPIPPMPSFVKVLNTEGQRGVSYARNMALAQARAPLFVCLDADDILQPSALEEMLLAYRQSGNYIYTDWIEHEKNAPREAFDYDPEGVLYHALHAVTALHTIESWKQVGGYDEDPATPWEDWDFQIKLAEKGFCGERLPRPLLTYRIISGKRREDQMARVEELKKVVEKRWAPYYNGEKKLMACGSCGGQKKATPLPTVPDAMLMAGMSSVSADGSAILIEYTGRDAPRYYRGPSGTSYRFGTNGHSIKYVHVKDVSFFEGREGFRLFQPASTLA